MSRDTYANARNDLHTRGIRIRDVDYFFYDLNRWEKDVIEMRYPRRGAPSTWDEIGEVIGCHRETARRDGKRALDKVSRWVRQGATRRGTQPLVRTAGQPSAFKAWESEMASASRVDMIATNLFQSGVPNERRLADNNIGFVVDVSAQPKQWNNPERPSVVRVLHDGPYLPTPDVMVELASSAADAVRKGIPTMIHCQMGWNRSGLIMGLTLWMLTGAAGRDIVKQIQGARKEALGNNLFRQFIESLPAADVTSPSQAVEFLQQHTLERKFPVRAY